VLASGRKAEVKTLATNSKRNSTNFRYVVVFPPGLVPKLSKVEGNF
jgi:hypothetical protein